ncbi:UvrD-helicase domain-containing protein [Aureimonas altamirensis]|uniref:ATP-dependent helicase n=1 Tax=Aureimonas altamirensis TaxID=370622 RepID=UPI002036ADD8|nr:UvrD-helicase domain-containing protein [Aureimonas altamirensis]MCM2503689.1 UvrD-helicase domain-containing protein [Aureimonas altamirensis]
MTDSTDNPGTPPASPKAGIAARALAGMRPRMPAGQEPAYFAGLNAEQRAAVETTEGPVLVLAGAGTGKTRVLTTRIAHILATGRAYPSQILAVTFTNKAAREMKTRIGLLVGEEVEGMPWLGTFHSIGVRILRRHAELVGLKPNFTILDTDDQIRLIKQLIQAENLDDKRWPARTFANLMDGWKNKALTPDRIPEGDARAFGDGKGRLLYQAYQERLRQLNAADFGDLLMHPIEIFKNNASVLDEYHRRFRYILVDEYQDTNVAQYLWLRLLAQRTGQDGARNVCCVGDDDQSIYGWRGAEVDNILRFEKDFPGAVVIRLERNYRSTAHILGAAGQLIAHNEDRLGKTLFTERADPEDELVSVNAAWDSEEEARAVGEEVEQLQRKGHALNDMAILVRASFQMREFEDRFVTLGVNYRVIGGPRFYERLEIRDALAYFRATVQPADDLAFERIVNTPKRGLGEAAIRLIHEYARARQVPLLAAAAELIEGDELKPRPRAALAEVVANFHRWRDLVPTMRHTDLAEMILDESGYTAMWQNDRSAEAPGRLENLKELIRSMDDYESLPGFLEHIALVMDAEQNEQMDAISIMTLHSAKGLEFETVFLPGWEEGLFPHQRALDEGGRSGLEEERRLAYVGLTRGKKRVKIWFVSNRRIHGLWQSTIPSRFLDELPEEHVEVIEAPSTYGGYGASRWDQSSFSTSSYQTPGWRRAQAAGGGGGYSGGRGGGIAYADKGPTSARDRAAAQADRYINRDGTLRDEGAPGFAGRMTEAHSMRPSRGSNQPPRKGAGLYSSARDGGPREISGELVAKSVAEEASAFSTGDRVFHMKFGNGTVASVEGNKLTIDFDKAGQKRVLDGFVQPI